MDSGKNVTSIYEVIGIKSSDVIVNRVTSVLFSRSAETPTKLADVAWISMAIVVTQTQIGAFQNLNNHFYLYDTVVKD